MSGGETIRVMIVDDHAVVRQGLRTFLDLQDHITVVGEGRDGADAVAQAEELAPDVILMDLMMPVLNGLEATRLLKADARTRGIPILALTGNVTPSGEQAARTAGCDDFLAKPIVLKDLIDRLHEHAGA